MSSVRVSALILFVFALFGINLVSAQDNQSLYGITLNPLQVIKIIGTTNSIVSPIGSTGPLFSQGVEYGVSTVDYRRSLTYFIAYNSSGTLLCGFNYTTGEFTQPTVLNNTSAQVFGMHYDGTRDALVVLYASELVSVLANSTGTVLGRSPLPAVFFPVEGGVTTFDRGNQTLYFVASDGTNTSIVGVKIITSSNIMMVVNATLHNTEIISMQFDDGRLFGVIRTSGSVNFSLVSISFPTSTSVTVTTKNTYSAPLGRAMLSNSSLRPNSNVTTVNSNATITNQYLSAFVSVNQTIVPVSLDTFMALSPVTFASATLVAVGYPTVAGCDGIPSSTKRFDNCGVCGGINACGTNSTTGTTSSPATTTAVVVSTAAPVTTTAATSGTTVASTSAATATEASSTTSPSVAPTHTAQTTDSLPPGTENPITNSSSAAGILAGNLLFVIIGVAAAVLLLLIIIIVVLLVKRNRRKNGHDSGDNRARDMELSAITAATAATTTAATVDTKHDNNNNNKQLNPTPYAGVSAITAVKQEKKKKDYDDLPANSSNNNNNSRSEDWWRIRYEELTLGPKLGQGGFGVVYKGTWKNKDVAIKMLLNEGQQLNKQDYEEFQKEANLMINLKPHRNVVELYGVCIDPKKPMCIVTEYLEKGSLRDLLDNTDVKITMLQVIQAAKDIAKGILHLHQENIYHRDLSARNVLVTERKKKSTTSEEGEEDSEGTWICKVADFGLSRYVSQGTEGTTKSDTGPLKWMAPESLMEKKYSAKSDVWAFGVTLWEIICRQEPYPDLDNVQAASGVMYKGLRLKPPEFCPPKLAQLMSSCFETSPETRPGFKSIIKMLREVEVVEIKDNPFY